MILLSVCIPTYKRQDNLRRCIQSVIDQIERYDLSDTVLIYVVDDASPDDTKAVMDEYRHLGYFHGISRQENLGMNQNIKIMLQEAAVKSRYQLILTDDDYLQLDALKQVVDHLVSHDDATVVWTPRYSYTEDDKLHTILCRPFNSDRQLAPSAFDAGRYMDNGFVLSGLIIRNDAIDFSFWDHYKDNAYFPAIFFGDILLRSGARYWPQNIVRHTVLNECHWDRWGKNDIMISLRLFSDFISAYKVLALRVKGVERILFYIGSLAGLTRVVNGPLTFDALRGDKIAYMGALKELKQKGYLKFSASMRLVLVVIVSMQALLAVFKATVLILLGMVDSKSECLGKRRDAQLSIVRLFPGRFRLMLGL